MKKNSFCILGFLLLFITVASPALAQMFGTVTINSAMPASSTNFTSFTTLASALNTAVVSGPLIVNVAPNSGPYIEQPVFLQALGVSATNSITINGNNNLLTYTNSSSSGNGSWALLLKGADFMHFNNLNISAFGTNYFAYACVLSNGSNHNYFKACSFSVTANNSTFNENPLAICSTEASPNAPSSGDGGSYNTFEACTMFSGAYGVFLSGSTSVPFNTGNSFINCRMTDWSYYGLRGEYQENLTVKGCRIDRPTRPQFAVGYGLAFYQNIGGLLCQTNCIENLSGGNSLTTGHLHGIYYASSATNSGTILNTFSANVISNIVTKGATFGMEMINLNGRCVNNIIELNNGSTASTASCVAFYAQPSNTTTDTLKVLGNYFALSHNGSGTKYCVYLTATARTKIDNNIYYINPSKPGTNLIGYSNGNISTFSQWKALGHEVNGTSRTIDQFAANPVSCESRLEPYLTSVNENLTSETITIFPNPADKEFSIEFADTKNKRVEVFGVSGRIYFSESGNTDKIKINTSEFSSGIYFIKIQSDTFLAVRKIIVK